MGSLVGCNKDDDAPFVIVVNKDIASAVDIDGNIYRTVQIGTQTWMMENLKVAHYRNGDSIPNIVQNEDWYTLLSKKGAWCSFEHSAINDSIYGKLYNWYALDDPRGLAPEGWHVPSSQEWKTLTDYLGYSVAGGMMKETGSMHWNDPNMGATNETCFTGLPGGFRDGQGRFYFLGDYGSWWHAETSPFADIYAQGEQLSFDNSYLEYFGTVKDYGYSVRCVKD